MCYNISKIIIVITLVFALNGCASTPEHTNTLLFGTTTKFALDVSVNPTGGTPDFTLGYKRHEGVWMPLLANQKTDDKIKPATCTDCKFKGTDKSGEKEDTYSVLASFGAKFSGGAETSSSGKIPNATTSARGGLAQFFATGIAAQKLAEHGNARLVAVQPVDQEQLYDAKTRAEKAEQKVENVQSNLIKILGEQKYSEEEKRGRIRSSLLIAKKDIVLLTVAPIGELDTTKWIDAVEKTSLDKNTKDKLKTKTIYEDIKNILTTDAAMSGTIINALYDAVKK